MVPTKSARKGTVPSEQSPGFLQQQNAKVQEQVESVTPQNQDNYVSVLGEQGSDSEKDNSD